MVEIERKFLVNKLPDITRFVRQPIKQGFLNSDPERTVRVRVIGNNGFLTIKGIGNSSGVTRFEWEKEISVEEATQLLKITEPGCIEKTRYFIPNGIHTIELDIFENENEGLMIAEIELSSEEEDFYRPDWLGEEVTGVTKYYNSSLAKTPYKSW